MTALAVSTDDQPAESTHQVQYAVSGYRWVVLLSIVPILAITQMYWLTFSAIAPQAANHYHTDPLTIAALSMSYMVAYIVLSVPASMLADRKGIRSCLLLGALITAVFGLLRGVVAGNFALVAVAQVGLACAQPFVMNPVTKLAAQWFPMGERATVSGIASVAGYLGIVVAMAVTPGWYDAVGMGPMLMVLGVIAVLAALLVLLGVREKPAVPPGPSASSSDALQWRAALDLRSNRNYMVLLGVVMIALGVFNALLTCLTDIMAARGFSSDASGLVASAIILFGIVGAVVLPLLSDRLHRRRVFLIVAMAVSLVAMVGMAYATNYGLLIASGALSGFFLMGSGPLIFQYGTEEGYPTPEGTTYGLMMASGQVSGIVFIVMVYLLQAPDGSMAVPMTILVAFMAIAMLLVLRAKESRFGKVGA